MMEFEEEDDEEEEEEKEEHMSMLITPISFNSSGSGQTHDKKPPAPIATCRYRECLKNHAVSIGGHAVDGCGEFMPAGNDALNCAACNCHRNFHRKEILLESSNHLNQLAIYSTPPSRPHYQLYRSSPSSFVHVSPRPRPLTAAGGGSEQQEEGGMTTMMMTSSSCRKKRFRTKFTQEQKEKMVELAEQLEWKIQKQDEAAVMNFCNETGVKRHVLKVWMHNNKHTVGKKDLQKP